MSRAKPQSRKELGRCAGVGDFQTVGIGAGPSKPRLRRPDRWPHPKPLCASAALRETNNADPTTARSKSRSPPNPDRSRRAAEPQRFHLKRGRWGPPDRGHRSGTPRGTAGLVALNLSAPLATRFLRPSESRQTLDPFTRPSVSIALCPLCHCGSFVRSRGGRLARASLVARVGRSSPESSCS